MDFYPTLKDTLWTMHCIMKRALGKSKQTPAPAAAAVQFWLWSSQAVGAGRPRFRTAPLNRTIYDCTRKKRLLHYTTLALNIMQSIFSKRVCHLGTESKKIFLCNFLLFYFLKDESNPCCLNICHNLILVVLMKLIAA